MIIVWFTTIRWSGLINSKPEINKFMGVSDGPIVCFVVLAATNIGVMMMPANECLRQQWLHSKHKQHSVKYNDVLGQKWQLIKDP